MLSNLCCYQSSESKVQLFLWLLGICCILVVLDIILLFPFMDLIHCHLSVQILVPPTIKKSPARTLQLVVIAGVVPLLAVAWLITLIFRFNVADSMVDTYFN